MKILLKCIAVGVASAFALGALTFALAPFFDMVAVYIAPFGLLAPILDKVPQTFVNRLDLLLPDSGPAAGVAVILAGTLLFWTIIFGALYFAWVTLRRRQSAKRAMANSQEAVPVQLVDATPSELEALITGGVYDRKEAEKALGSAESRDMEALEGWAVLT